MQSKLARIGRFSAYTLLTNIVYGFLLYSLVTWLAGFSFVLAYLGNFAMIIFGLSLDTVTLKSLQSEKMVAQIKRDKDAEVNYRLIRWLLRNYVSFKAVLMLFYAILLIGSQIINFTQAVISENLQNFIRTTEYSILLIVAFDEFTERFTQGRKKTAATLERFEKYWADGQD